jgi:hypothetical protein
MTENMPARFTVFFNRPQICFNGPAMAKIKTSRIHRLAFFRSILLAKTALAEIKGPGLNCRNGPAGASHN